MMVRRRSMRRQRALRILQRRVLVVSWHRLTTNRLKGSRRDWIADGLVLKVRRPHNFQRRDWRAYILQSNHTGALTDHGVRTPQAGDGRSLGVREMVNFLALCDISAVLCRHLTPAVVLDQIAVGSHWRP